MLVQTEISAGQIEMKLCTNFHGSQRMNPTDFVDPLTFPPVPSWFTFVILSEMSTQLLNRLPYNLVHMLTFPDSNNFGYF